MKRFIAVLFLTLAMIAAGLYGSVLMAQEAVKAEAEEKEKEEPGGIGLTIGLDYYSDYLWRGTYFYGKGGGAFYPNITWDIFETGLSIGVAAEVAVDYLFESTGRNTTGFKYHSVDFGIDYSHTFAELVTLDVGLWYWYYYNSKDAFGADASFLTATVSVGFDVILSPFISFTYDYYVDKNIAFDKINNKDFYVQAGIGHDFELTKEVALNLGLSAGYYHAPSIDKSGISDVTAKVGLEVAVGVATFTSSFNYVAVPTKEFYEGDDIHRWFASFGASVSI